MNTEILQKYIKGCISEQEALEVAAWIAASDENKREYMALRKLYDIAIWRTDKEDEQEETHKTVFILFIRRLLQAAAVALVIFSFVYLWSQNNLNVRVKDNLQSVYAPVGQRTELILADGTKVWLNSNSSLKYGDFSSQDCRVVELDGEGYFNVTKNPDKPFIVKTNKYNIKVLGTEFNVMAYSSLQDWNTSLINGKIEINTDNGDRLMTLEPNTLAYIKDGKLMKKTLDLTEDEFKWRKGQISFDNLSMQEIIHKLEIYYDVKIIVKRKGILKNSYTGTFAVHDGISHILNVLSAYDKFEYTIEKDNIIVIR